MPEQALGGIPLGLGLVVKINLLNIHDVHVQWDPSIRNDCMHSPRYTRSMLNY